MSSTSAGNNSCRNNVYATDNYVSTRRPNYKFKVLPVDMAEFNIRGALTPINYPLKITIRNIYVKSGETIKPSRFKEVLFELQLPDDVTVKTESLIRASRRVSRIRFEKKRLLGNGNVGGSSQQGTSQQGTSQQGTSQADGGNSADLSRIHGLFRCAVCRFMFTRKDVFIKHIDAHMIHNCNQCEAKFVFKKDLVNHVKIHISRKRRATDDIDLTTMEHSASGSRATTSTQQMSGGDYASASRMTDSGRSASSAQMQDDITATTGTAVNHGSTASTSGVVTDPRHVIFVPRISHTDIQPGPTSHASATLVPRVSASGKLTLVRRVLTHANSL